MSGLPLRREDPKWKFVQVRCNQYLSTMRSTE
jgi:hypothetical protein